MRPVYFQSSYLKALEGDLEGLEDFHPSRTLATDCSKKEHAVKTAWSPSIIHPDIRWQCQAPYMQGADLLIGPV